MAASEAALAEKIREGGPFDVTGSGSKRGLGQAMAKLPKLSLAGFNGVELYQPDELVLEAGAATPLDEIEALLEANGQQLAFEPPDYGALLGTGKRGTLGGAIACNLSGPRRLKAGAARDHVLGFTGVNGKGEIYKAGGRVVKNVTGFDLAKLMAGSYGTLTALTRIAVKVLPAAAHEETLVLEPASEAIAIEAMSLALQSACEVSSAAHVEGQTLLRLEGSLVSIAARREKLARLLGALGSISLLDDTSSRKLWRAIRDGAPLDAGEDRQVWRISVAPLKGAGVVHAISRQIDCKHYYDWGGGLIWLSIAAQDDAAASLIRGSFAEGHATLLKAEAEVRRNVDVFQPVSEAVAALEMRVKRALDPEGKFNPGRMRRQG
jgi:glycolate oxidase FAD binding subunit